MEIFARSDIGKARDMNQDSYLILEEENYKLLVLADGMGGYKGGEIASSLAVNAIQNYIKNNFEATEKTTDSILKLINDAIEYANMIVYEKSQEVEELKDMGTTLDTCIVFNGKLYIGHVGDSRVYRIRKNIIRKITTDHSYVEKLVKEGTITKEEAKNHPKKNMLTKALGCSSFVEPDLLYKVFQKEDILLMCSDGLTNMLNEEIIYNIITKQKSAEENSLELINLANDLGGYDNITAIIVKNK